MRIASAFSVPATVPIQRSWVWRGSRISTAVQLAPPACTTFRSWNPPGDVRALRGGITYIRQILRGAQDKPERSPVNLADRIKARVLLMHGGEDRRAPMEHARRMRAALEEAGNPAEWLYDIEQGHGAAGNEPRREMYQRVLDFLAENTMARSTDEG